jgi:2-polyprenyl-3-methyl-5-hydroxy-6-metoxy-1,4-benzoquinol methylase
MQTKGRAPTPIPPKSGVLDRCRLAITAYYRRKLWSAKPSAVGKTNAPYEDVLTDASEHGLVLKRDQIYGSGPPVDDLSGDAQGLVRQYANGRVFDIGAGCGALQRFLPESCTYVGMELNPNAVKMARDLKRNVVEGDAVRSGFSDNSFDTCTMLEVLEHIDDYETALREAARLAPRLILTVPNIATIPALSAYQVVPWHLLEATHVNFFTPESLRKTLLRFYGNVRVWEINPWFEPGLFMNIAAVASR